MQGERKKYKCAVIIENEQTNVENAEYAMIKCKKRNRKMAEREIYIDEILLCH